MRAILAALAMLLAAAAPAAAQSAAEGFEIGLSTDTITVGTNFGGSRLVVFGALDNADTRVLRQGRYDIVVVLEGPRRNVVVRQRDRVFGIWINRGSERFDNLPQSYALSSSRPLRDTHRMGPRWPDCCKAAMASTALRLVPTTHTEASGAIAPASSATG